MTGSEHTGPIVFSDSTARGQLLNHGQVITFRRGERTTGETWWRKSRTGEKMGDCHVREIGHVNPLRDAHLEVFQPHSGFRSVGSWQDAIERLNGGEMPDDGVLYHVTAIQDECGKCGEVSYLPTNTFCPSCHREEAARADGGTDSTGSERGDVTDRGEPFVLQLKTDGRPSGELKLAGEFMAEGCGYDRDGTIAALEEAINNDAVSVEVRR